MKKKFAFLALALVMCLVIVPTTYAYGPPDGVYIDEGSAITVNVGDSGKLTGYSIADDQEVYWTSSDSSGVSIDRTTGAYKANRAGSYVMTATLKDGSFSAKTTITVKGPAGITATPSSAKITVNGKSVAADAYTINDSNYIKLRDLATMVNGTAKNFNVEWDGGKNAINLKALTAYAPVGGEMAKGDGKAKEAKPTTSTIYVNGAEASLSAYLIGGNNYFKLRDVMAKFDIAVGWDQATGTATVNTEAGK